MSVLNSPPINEPIVNDHGVPTRIWVRWLMSLTGQVVGMTPVNVNAEIATINAEITTINGHIFTINGDISDLGDDISDINNELLNLKTLSWMGI